MIPLSSNASSHETLAGTSPGVGSSFRRVSSREIEVADFGLTVGVDQEVTRLELMVNDVSRANALEAAKGLIN